MDITVTSPIIPSYDFSFDTESFRDFEEAEDYVLNMINIEHPNVTYKDLVYTCSGLTPNWAPITQRLNMPEIWEYESLKSEETFAVDAWLADHNFAEAGSIKTILNALIVSFDSLTEFAQYTHLESIPSQFESYIDWETMGSDMMDENSNLHEGANGKLYWFDEI